MNTEHDEKSKDFSETDEGEENYAFKKVMTQKNKENRRTWSVASLILAVLSVLLVYFSWASVVLSLASIGCAFVSRKNIGYFDKLSLAGIIVGIFGCVFALGGIAFSELLSALLF